MLVTVENGKATKVRGDPDHPFTQGGLCVKVNDYTTHTYSPDRVLYPLRRVGPKGSGQFDRISWDEALDEIATRFQGDHRRVRRRRPSSPTATWGPRGPQRPDRGRPVLPPPGGHRLASGPSATRAGCTAAYLHDTGPAAGMDPESFVHSRYIILWACNVRSTNLHMWPFIKEAQDTRRQGRRHRPAAAPDGAERRLVHPHPAGDRRARWRSG